MFINLHNHSMFSVLDGLIRPKEYVDLCVKHNMPAFAITDHGSLAAIPEAYFESKTSGVKLIVGVEAYYNDYHLKVKEILDAGGALHRDSEEYKLGRPNMHITLLAKNGIGYRNILHIMRDAHSEGFYFKPRTWFDKLKQYKDGLIVLSGCYMGPAASELDKYYADKDEVHVKRAEDYIARFKEVFGDDFYMELQMPGATLESSKWTLEILLAMAKASNIKTVLTNDIHYVNKEDAELHRMLMAISQQKTIYDKDLSAFRTSEQYFKNEQQLIDTYREQYVGSGSTEDDIREAMFNTIEVADKCEPFLPDLKSKLPSIDNADDELCRKVAEALHNKGLDTISKKFLIDGKEVTYVEQASIELSRIIEKGFSAYFLITADLVNHAKDKWGNMSIGPGRGSVGGSLVSYLLNIHEIDPMIFGLSFVRFLSPSRGGNMLKVTMQ